MQTIHAQLVGDHALLPRTELERLVELACRAEQIALELREEGVPTLAVMRLAERGGAFAFWHEEGEAIYSAQDGEPL
jgi:hypothetical protein